MSFKPANAANTTLETMRKAVALQQAGEIEKAQRLYKTVLKKNPSSPDANHLLGVCYRQLGFPKRAVEFIGKAISLAPDRAPYHANLARALSDIGAENHAEVLAAAERAVALNPGLAEAQSLRAVAMTKLDREQEAEEIFKQIIVDHPNYGDAYRNYGVLLRDQKRHAEAVEFFDKAVQFAPDNPNIWLQRARSRMSAEQLDIAHEELREAVNKFPGDHELMHEMARVLFALGEPLEALSYAEAAAAAPHEPTVDVTLAIILLKLDRPQEGIQLLEKALAQSNNDQPNIEWNLALAYLGAGDLKNGWKHYGARFRANIASCLNRKFNKPEWDGSDLTGKTIMIWNDQGVGDCLRYGTLIQDIMDVAGKVIIELPQKLLAPFRLSFPDAVIRTPTFETPGLTSTSDDYDFQISSADLPRHIRPDLQSFQKTRHPVFKVNLERSRELYGKIPDADSKPVVGISWRSSRLAPARSKNYLSVMDFAPIVEVEDIVFVNLQYTYLEREIIYLQQGRGANLVHFSDIDQMNNIEDAAALANCCDLIVTVNTSVADIAGCYGIPHWTFGENIHHYLFGQEVAPWFQDTTYTKLAPGQAVVELIPGLVERLEHWKSSFSSEKRMKRLQL
ncbi:tetratricopeptide repeat protein [Pannonibacter phragmitetus]|uniref:tetratricopeptide repeat protein n=1 Tax=Pannonibacter phragmitetus TaxID=121719 RepID=UPI003D2F3CAE